MNRIVERKIRRATETKVCDHWIIPTDTLSSGAVYNLLTQLTRGQTGYNNFEGNSITPTGLMVNYRLTGALEADSHSVVRVVIGQHLTPGQPSVSEIIQWPGYTYSSLSARTWEFRKNFKIYHDQFHTLNREGENSQSFSVRIPGAKMIKLDSLSNVLSSTIGALFMLVISDDGMLPPPLSVLIVGFTLQINKMNEL